MRITAHDVIASWTEFDRTAPYHTENKPVGKDRKQHEGPFPTNETFKDSWLPTEKDEPAEQMAVEQVQIVKVEVVAKKGVIQRVDYVMPRVPRSLFQSWEEAHEFEAEFDSTGDIDSFDNLIQAILTFIKEGNRVGLNANPTQVQHLSAFQEHYQPESPRGYTQAERNEIVGKLDGILNRIHEEILNLTNTTREAWYNIRSWGRGAQPQPQERPVDEWTGLPFPERAEGDFVQEHRPMTLDKLRERRGPMSPFYEDMWERQKRRELRGMRITAVDVDLKKQRPPKKKDQTVQQELDAPQELTVPPMYQPSGEPIEPMPAPESPINPATITKTIGEWDWEEQEEGEGPGGSIFSYRKSIVINEDEDPLEFYAFVEPLAVRKSRLMEQAKQLSRHPDPERRRQRQQEAEQTPDTGYINDIEVFYNGDLLFHRERAFRPGRELSSREFMAGDSMQRAINDLQKFVRTKIDPIPVRQFYQNAIENPGVGEGKLSMKITAADVIPFDPNKRKLKTEPPVRKGPNRVESPGMEEAFQSDFPNLDAPLQGDGQDDHEAILYMVDNVAGGLNDALNTVIQHYQQLQRRSAEGDPKAKVQVGEISPLINKLRRAIQVFG
jgi:hypothetical protein